MGLSSCNLGKTTGRYSATKPGPLDDGLAETFAGGRYNEVILSRDVEFYRAGVDGRPFGRFFSRDRTLNVIPTRINKAVLPRWPNGGASPIDSVFKVKIPAGTKGYVG